MPDRAAIFTGILSRNALRREAHLPIRDVRATYGREVEQALWYEHVRQHAEKIRVEVLRRQRPMHGPNYPQSSGGRIAVACLVHCALRQGFLARRSN